MREKTIFEKIIDREISAEIVYEDNDFIAFLSIDPRAPGHTLVVPKLWCHWVWDHPDTSAYFKVVKMLALALRKAYNTELVRSSIYGEEIPHAHVHVYPNVIDDTMKDLAKHAEMISKALI